MLLVETPSPLRCTLEETDENIIAGCGELHIEICLNDLEKDYAQCDIIKSDSVVTYKECITEVSSQVAMSKSHNKHNRINGTAVPLHEDLPELIENGDIGPTQDPKERSKRLIEEFE